MNQQAIFKTLLKFGPKAILGRNIELTQDESTGKISISKWNEKELGAQPSDEEFQSRLKTEEDALLATNYKKKRRHEYPPIEDYLDGIVKGDQAQIQKYIDDCLQ